MRSSASRARVTVVAAALGLFVCAAAEAQTARARYEAATRRDEQVRAQLTKLSSPTPSPELMAQVTQVMTAFEAVVRRFPTSGYADNALFQAATLAEAAYETFNRPEDRDRAVRLYRWLVQEYPASSLVKRAHAQIASLTKPTPPPAPVPTDAGRATLLNIQRTVMPDLVRVTIELDREVRFLEQRLAGPERVFFDLQDVQLTPALLDQVLTFPSDVVSKIRTGRHPNHVVRVVLDLEDVAKYSVFRLYNPFRLVVDAERAPTRAATVTAPPAPVPLDARRVDAGVLARAVTAEAPPEAQPEPEPVPAAKPAEPMEAPKPPAANAAGGFSIARQLGLSVSRIVIDPGHGGHDPGVLGRGLSEAALVLDVALRLEKLLAKEPGVEVVLTRRTNVYVPLEERTEIANRQHADMFLSIHANASRNVQARGVETYYLSFASSPDAEAVAARENSASTRVMNQLPDLVKAITLNSKLDESRDLATMVQNALVSNLKKANKNVVSRGVKKAPFVVLIGAQMPSVLAEISFVSNRQELALLKTNAYKQRIAESLFDAVMKYRRSLKNQVMTALPDR
jgi:N-acetylmuramoyl-L-alanine amidase